MPADRINSFSPWHLVLVLDDSGSMQGSKIQMLNEAMERMIDEMRMLSGGMKPYFRISIVRFGSQAEVITVEVRPDDRVWIEVGGVQGAGSYSISAEVIP